MAARIRGGEITPVDAVEAHIGRVIEVNPHLNAVAEERFEKARQEAEAMTLWARGNQDELPPLFGVPFTVKEMLAVEDMKSTAGSLHYRDEKPSREATVVSRMKAAGAIAIATTNVPELGLWFETDNPLYGRTNNPYDLSRTCGGSSGGEGALVGAGASPFGLGSDIGGSIRMPAAFCGIFGHKPTNRVVPLSGHFPYSPAHMAKLTGPVYPYTSVGPLARKARDLQPLLKLLVGRDDLDPETLPFEVPELKKDLATWTVFVCDDPKFHACRETEDETREGVRNAARLFEQYGAQVRELDPRLFSNGAELWAAALRSTKEGRFGDLLSRNQPLSLWKELSRIALGRGRYTVPALLTAVVEDLTVPNPEETARLLGELRDLRAKFDALLGENGILLMPTHPRTAPKHKSPWLTPFDFIHAGVFNVLGNPATTAPVGLDSKGLPLAVQIIARPFRDDLTIAAAEIIEDGFGGWKPPMTIGT